MKMRILLATFAVIVIAAVSPVKAMTPAVTSLHPALLADKGSGYMHADLKDFVPPTTILEAKTPLFPIPGSDIDPLFMIKISPIGGSGDIMVGTSNGEGSSCISPHLNTKYSSGSSEIIQKTGQFVEGGGYVFGAGNSVTNGKNLSS
jgi:hypothetical protein